MAGAVRNMMKEIPKVDRILGWPEISAMLAKYPRPEVLVAVRRVLDQLREHVSLTGDAAALEPGRICARVSSELASRTRPSLQAVVNGTGVVVHTNLGRSPLADEAEDAIHTVSAGYSNLEFDLESGERGTRYAHVEGLICELTGAEAALVVNNKIGRAHV